MALKTEHRAGVPRAAAARKRLCQGFQELTLHPAQHRAAQHIAPPHRRRFPQSPAGVGLHWPRRHRPEGTFIPGARGSGSGPQRAPRGGAIKGAVLPSQRAGDTGRRRRPPRLPRLGTGGQVAASGGSRHTGHGHLLPLRKGEQRRGERLHCGRTFSALITPDSCNLQVFGG